MLRALDDQLAKRLLCATYEKVAVAHVEEELLPDAQAVDAWFEPDPSYAADLAERGLLGRMMPRGIATIFEAYSDSPTVVEYRSCVRKQLTLDHLRGKEASKNKEARPEIPWLWMLSAGQPRSVLDGYGFTPISDLPPGFWQRQPADAVGLVVMRDLPKTRETLLLRLMGGRQLRKEAMAELLLLPKDAWERQVAMPPLVALRQIAEQDPDAEAREYMIDTNVLYSQWEEKTLEEGRKAGLSEGRAEGLAEALLTTWEARFGVVPERIRALVEVIHDPDSLRTLHKLALAPTTSAEQLTALIEARSTKKNGTSPSSP